MSFAHLTEEEYRSILDIVAMVAKPGASFLGREEIDELINIAGHATTSSPTKYFDEIRKRAEHGLSVEDLIDEASQQGMQSQVPTRKQLQEALKILDLTGASSVEGKTSPQRNTPIFIAAERLEELLMRYQQDGDDPREAPFTQEEADQVVSELDPKRTGKIYLKGYIQRHGV